MPIGGDVLIGVRCAYRGRCAYIGARCAYRGEMCL